MELLVEKLARLTHDILRSPIALNSRLSFVHYLIVIHSGSVESAPINAVPVFIRVTFLWGPG